MVISFCYFIDVRDVEGVLFDILCECVMEIVEFLLDWGLFILYKWVVLENLIVDMKLFGCKVVFVEKL